MENMLLFSVQQEEFLCILTIKKFHSIALLAVVNARYEFSVVEIGDYGRLSESSVYANSNLWRAINQNYSFPLQENWLTTIPKNILMFSLGMKLSHYVVIF